MPQPTEHNGAPLPGQTWGVLVGPVSFAKGFTGSLRALKPGEVLRHTDVVDQARREAIERLIAHAQSLGATMRWAISARQSVAITGIGS